MKKFYSFLVAAVLLMGATSCQKEATADAGAADNVEFVASIAGGRTELGDSNKVMWNNGDKIRIFTQGNFAGTEFNSDATAATATAKFTTTKSFTASNSGYLAVYPETANTGNATCEDGVWSIPVNMMGWDGNPFNYPFTFEKNAFMAAFSNDNQLSFKAATALLKIKNIDNSKAGEIHFSGDVLGGEATLLYDTNTAEISYTLGNGNSVVQYNFPEQNGETIYIPIYPGTVTGFEVYGADWQNPLVTYNKTITFKAGVIYDLDLDNAGGNTGGEEEEDCPWSIVNGMMQEVAPMVVENDYYVAKNIPFNENGYWIMGSDQTILTVYDVTMNTWMEVQQGSTMLFTFEPEYADIYLSKDASLMCIVPASENLPALPVKTVSPWVLSDGMTTEVTMYVDDNGYHYAKNVPDGSWWIYPENRETSHGLPVETAEAGTWYKTASSAKGGLPIGLEESGMSVYLSPEADFVCLLWPGMELPELPEVSTLWGMAGTHQANQWTAGNPSEMYVVGDYAVAYNIPGGSQFKFIDKVNGGSNGWDNAFGATNENAMMAQVRNVCGGSNVTLPTEATSYDIYLNKTNNYFVIVPVGATLGSAPTKLYMQPRPEWMEAGARFVAYFCNNGEDWVDMTDSDSDGVYECDVPTKEYPVVLFLRMNPSGSNAWSDVWNQTGDLCVPLDGTNFATITSAGDDWNAVNVTWSTK